MNATFLQIDLQNLFFEAKRLGEKIDFEKVYQYFNSRGSEFLNNAIIYIIQSDEFDSSKFEVKLRNIGYQIKAKSVQKVFRDNRTIYKMGNHDVGITIDCLDALNTFDKWILMSGDGDFVDLCKYLKNKDKKIEIWSFKNCYNSNLEQYADKIYFIDEQFFYKRPKVAVFGFNWNWGPNENL